MDRFLLLLNEKQIVFDLAVMFKNFGVKYFTSTASLSPSDSLYKNMIFFSAKTGPGTDNTVAG
eukprot:SAG11_NODE_706_length_7651_cov_4.192399_3_plen_63_part_00